MPPRGNKDRATKTICCSRIVVAVRCFRWAEGRRCSAFSIIAHTLTPSAVQRHGTNQIPAGSGNVLAGGRRVQASRGAAEHQEPQ